MKTPTLPLFIAAALTSFIGTTKAPASTVIAFAYWGAPTSGQGVIGGPDDFWNQINTNGTSAIDGVTTTGDLTSITFTDTSPLSFQGPADAFVPLMTRYLFTNGVCTETLNNVPAGTYNLYLYGQNGTYNDRGVWFTLDGVSQAAVNRNGSGAAFIYGANYVEFTNITLASQGVISFTYSGGAGVSGEGSFNGLQLEVVPEPSTCALLGMGAIGSALIVRRRNRGTAG